ncbi:MAG: MliC family protein [bacterium]
MNKKTWMWGVGAVIVLVVIGYYFRSKNQTEIEKTPIALASYFCDAHKTIIASYYDGESKPAPSADQPPIPGGSVSVVLSDGRTMTLHQTISADGGRYANADESIVFWGKGRGAMFLEHDTQTYTGCIEAAKDSGGLPLVYTNGIKGFSIRYPVNYTVDESYVYQALGPGKDIAGIKFTIPVRLAKGTNLSTDSYVSVEHMPKNTECLAKDFLGAGAIVSTVDDNGTTYSVGKVSDAAAGNRYDETVYAISGSNPCVAVRYFVHYGVFENYPTGSITKFDEVSLIAQFDAIRKTLIIQ